MNKVILIGRLTKDPELRHTQSENAVAAFTLAVDRAYGKDAGADFIPCVAWKQAAETITRYTRKGNLLAVVGRMQFRKYNKKDGTEVKVCEVIVDDFQFLGSNDKNQAPVDVYPDDEDLPF